MKILKGICLIAIIISIVFLTILAIDISTLVETVNEQIPVVTGNVNKALLSIQDIETNTTRTEAEMAGLLNVSRHIAMDEQKSTEAQLQQITNIGNEISILVDNANGAINGATDDEKQISLMITQATDTIKETGDKSNQLIDNATQAIDPTDIKVIMNGLSTTTSNLAATTTDVRTAVNYEVTELMKPVKKIRLVADTVLHFVGKFLGY